MCKREIESTEKEGERGKREIESTEKEGERGKRELMVSLIQTIFMIISKAVKRREKKPNLLDVKGWQPERP